MDIETDCIIMEKGQRVAGLKQVTKGIINKEIQIVYLSVDCDSKLSEKIKNLCSSENVTVKKLYTQEELGNACGIGVGSAVVGIKKQESPAK